jgi:lysophospholipase L1-like esterase
MKFQTNLPKVLRAYVLSVVAIGSLISGALDAAACPAVAKLPDLNCDGAASIVVLGDSLVKGIGDTKNDNSGGYVLRTQEKFPGASVYGYGVPGLRTQPLLSTITKAFSSGVDSELKLKLIEADLVVLDLGRNDRWFFGLPEATLRNLKRIRSLIEKKVTEHTGASPLIVTAVLMYPNRGAQAPWVKELDQLILKSHTPQYPADLRFDTVSKRLLAPDNIHPTSKGYASMANTFTKYLLKEYKTYAALARDDVDNDGLYDIYERSKFGTDPSNPDTDGDGIKDGADSTPRGS